MSLTFHSAGDILRYYFCRRRLDALHTVAKVILVALSTQNYRYLVIHHRHYCLNTQFSQPRPAVAKTAYHDTPETNVTVSTLGFCLATFLSPRDLLAKL
jgi:hypothetical protein